MGIDSLPVHIRPPEPDPLRFSCGRLKLMAPMCVHVRMHTAIYNALRDMGRMASAFTKPGSTRARPSCVYLRGKPMMPPADRIHPNPGQCSNKIRSVAYAKEKKESGRVNTSGPTSMETMWEEVNEIRPEVGEGSNSRETAKMPRSQHLGVAPEMAADRYTLTDSLLYPVIPVAALASYDISNKRLLID